MKVEKRTCNVGEYLPLRRRLKKKGYRVGIGQIHLSFVSKHSSKQFYHKSGEIGIRKCLPHFKLHIYWRFEIIYKPNLAGNGVDTPPAFLCVKPLKKSSFTSPFVQYSLKVVANKEM